MTDDSHAIEFSKPLKKIETPIPGLVIFDLALFGDNRGWFKENWQREKMRALGLPDFGPVQNNISYNTKRGATRGIHAEPWDKFVSLGKGRMFCAWVDIREGSPTYGTVFTGEFDSSHAIFVPAGIANSYQTLEDDTVYSYLVNDHWSPNTSYSFVNLADPDLAITWPIPLDQAEVSDKDKKHPLLKDAVPVPPKKILVTGANGQVGRALQALLPDAEFTTSETLDITSPELMNARRWRDYSTIINAAAYTAVDKAETPEGRIATWKVNASAVANLSQVATENNLTLVHISSEYVFDGTREFHDEDEPLSPLGVYAQSKAAGDVAAMATSKRYLVRTSWVIGDGNNFVRTMQNLAAKGVKPAVVSDQIGRPAFAGEIARGIKHLLDTKPAYGIYNLSNDGDAASWADVAKATYEAMDKPADDVSLTTTAEYFADKPDASPRPLQSTLDLDKIKATGFAPRDWRENLIEYVKNSQQ